MFLKSPFQKQFSSVEAAESFEKRAFLPLRDDRPSSGTNPASEGGNYSQSFKGYWILHSILVLLYTIAGVIIALRITSASEHKHNVLPHLRTQYVNSRFPLMRDSPYIGPPSTPVDEAWETLLSNMSNMSIRVSDSELAQHSLTSVSLARGGHLAWLGVFHELHCVKVLQKANYREYYHPAVAGQPLRDLQVHVDHCIELLRATVMCHPDVETLTTFEWRKGWDGPLLSPYRPIRRCMDWDMLMGSIHDRVVKDEELQELVNPLRSSSEM